MTIQARYSEHRRYDINRDCDTVVMMATTERGSYWTEVVEEAASKLRAQREQFKQFAIECIQKNVDPGEIELDA